MKVVVRQAFGAWPQRPYRARATLGPGVAYVRKPRRRAPQPREEEASVNEGIRAPRVILVDQDGSRLGEFLTRDAIQFARDRGLDLIEVASSQDPPTCRMAEWGKLRYDRAKRAAAARRNQRGGRLKELKVRPKTDDHDIDVKARRARQFLEAGDKVRIRVWFRGREHAHHQIGADQCHRIAEACGDVGQIEHPPRMEGRQMTMILSPI
jgi:translation initiation factor IF-3